jgi:hypothetical protein
VERLQHLVVPAVESQQAYVKQLKLRQRVLGMNVMVGLVLYMIWQQNGNVSEVMRIAQTESVLWLPKLVHVTQQAFSSRLGSLPADLFLRVLMQVLPILQRGMLNRKQRLPDELRWAQSRYRQIVACDGSTLDALLKKIGLLRHSPTTPLAGKMLAVLDLVTRLPTVIWYEEDAQVHDQSFLAQLLCHLKEGSLLIFDLGFTNFTFFLQLTEHGIFFVTRAKSNLSYKVDTVFFSSPSVRDSLVWIGKHSDRQLLRLVEVLHQGKWYRYLSNELSIERLPTHCLVALYWRRWFIEDAYNLVKRVLGLAFFWSGSFNAIQLQLWATWLLYSVLIDLTDELALELNLQADCLSPEMVYRSLYFFSQAHKRGEAHHLITFLAQHAEFLGILIRIRDPDSPSIFLSLQHTIAQLA